MPFTPGRPLAEAKADLFKALAHPARIRVLELLAAGEQTVGELAAGTGLELSHLSQQVTVLRKAGIVHSRRVGNNVICSLADPQTAELLAVARRMITAHLRQGQALLEVLDGARDAVARADSARPLSPAPTA
jgi:ArsR family transcriptional regulator